MFFYKENISQEIIELLLTNNSASSIFEYSDYITYDNTNGYYKDSTNWGSTVGLNISEIYLTNKIQATFTSYYNDPNGCLGQNVIIVSYTDGTSQNMGVWDGSVDQSSGQTIYKGDLGTETAVQRDVIAETYTITVPANKTVKSVVLLSNFLSGYPQQRRGVKDITIFKNSSNPYILESLPNNLASQVFTDTNSINWNSTRGYYRSSTNWSSAVDMIVSNPSSVKVVEATFTSYYNNPNGCLGQNVISIFYTDGTSQNMGVWDGSEDPASGQTLYKGDLGTETSQRDVVERTFSHIIPEGKTLQKLVFISNNLAGYPEQLRGVKNINLYRS
jgi:hypothetical protein